MLVIERLPCPQMRHGDEAINLGIHDQRRFR